MRLAHVLDQLVVVLGHVELEEGGARAGGWHPRALPRALQLDGALHPATGRERELAGEQALEPRRLQPVRQDVVECEHRKEGWSPREVVSL